MRSIRSPMIHDAGCPGAPTRERRARLFTITPGIVADAGIFRADHRVVRTIDTAIRGQIAAGAIEFPRPRPDLGRTFSTRLSRRLQVPPPRARCDNGAVLISGRQRFREPRRCREVGGGAVRHEGDQILTPTRAR